MRVSLINVHLIVQDAIAQCLIHQARVLRRRGDEVRIYCAYLPAGAPSDIAEIAREANLETYRDEHFAASDLSVFHYPGVYPLMDAMKAIDHGTAMFYYHNVTPPDLWGAEEDRDLLQRSVAAVGELTSHADVVVTDSLFNAEHLIADHGCARDRIRVLPLGVPVDQFKPGSRDSTLVEQYGLQDRRVMLFVGRMAGNKRIDLLVEALPFVRHHVPSATLMLVGDDRSHSSFVGNVARVRARAAELGLADDVIVTGKVENLADHYRLADVYATASLHEGFGVPLIEAMASGVPIVASRATAHPWVVQDAGLLAEPADPVDLARQIVRVLTDNVLRTTLVDRGLTRARQFTLEQYETNWSAIVAESTNLAQRR